ncbi:MAG: EAL domain-containing protein [Candidatus Hydrothermales bacterium]
MKDEITGLPLLVDIINLLKDRIEKEKEVNLLIIQILESSIFEEEFGFDVFDSWVKSLADLIKISVTKEFTPYENPLLFTTDPFSSLICLIFPKTHDPKKFITKLKNEIEKLIPAPTAITLREIKFDPLRRTERSIYQTVNEVKIEHTKTESRMKSNIKSLFKKIIRTSEIKMVFQPIFEISEEKLTYGFEALARGPKGTELEMPTALFSVADELNELENLEKLCRWKALLTSKRLPDEKYKIFLNVSSKILQQKSSYVEELIENLDELQIKTEKLVLEITERYAISDFDTLKKNINYLKERNIKLSIDDVGVGYSSLQTLAELNPDYLKYDMVLVRNIHEDMIKQNLLEMVLNFGEKIKAKVIAEGIEKEEELITLRKIGVRYGQGFYLSYPFEVEI